ncbi:PPC domain-containing protein [Hyphococcus flavus]|uniref:PPC domain-containing protein n=1 Tax=Hyphococcus flavus TaxID=1866326 RepID=A0AAF0CI33_9PROT|nr:PPC domain-containing protein [Hyphococcus flavus]WDI32472.1 PPC domain-containing protein [Hyphococcus flavus]
MCQFCERQDIKPKITLAAAPAEPFGSGPIRDHEVWAAYVARENESSGASSIVDENRATDADIPGGPGTSASISIGGSFSDTLEFAGDTDWIAVELEAGTSYLFTLTGTGVNALFDPFLEIRDEAGVKVAQDDDAGPGLNPQLRFTALETGTYYLVARSYEDENQSPTAGTYTLTADFGPPQNPLHAIDWGTKLANSLVDVFFVPTGQSAGGVQSEGWAQSQINAVMDVLQTISDVAGLTFNRVFSSVGAEFQLVTTSGPELTYAGRMAPPRHILSRNRHV